MTEEDANEAITQHWYTGWGALHGALSGDPVTSVLEGDLGDTSAEWVRMSIVPGPSSLETVDGLQRRRSAFITVQIFTPPLTSTRRASKLADDVRAVLEAQQIAPAVGDERVRTYAGSTSPPSPDGAWTMRLVTVPASWQG